jgi:hypothetical protein
MVLVEDCLSVVSLQRALRTRMLLN